MPDKPTNSPQRKLPSAHLLIRGRRAPSPLTEAHRTAVHKPAHGSGCPQCPASSASMLDQSLTRAALASWGQSRQPLRKDGQWSYFVSRIFTLSCALKTAAPHLGSSRFIGHGPTHCAWKPASADRDRPRHAHVSVAHPAFLPHVAVQIGKGARRHQYEPALAVPAGKDLDLGNLLIDLGGCLPSYSTSTLRVNISPIQVPAGNTLKKTG